ncbi:MAG: hypothetical protein IID49_12995 [Proteobacteria bacterium]|nr:hypothetical protein [Pseudomonadota bacterium]
MNEIERKILKKAWEQKGDLEGENSLTGVEISHLLFLRAVDPVYRLSQAQRHKLYRIGKKVGIDGRQEYATQILQSKSKAIARG